MGFDGRPMTAKRIIITGAGGFVGRALIAALGAEYDIIALDNRLAGIDGIEGDISDPAIISRAFAGGCDAVVHLATVPGGAAELNPPLAKQVNVDASMALVEAATASGACPTFIFASSIAVFGDPLPSHVDDETQVSPKMLYGAHKAMMEQWIATQSRRGAINGISLRLPGIVARPRTDSGMKSAFMSDVFHALKTGETFVAPVSPDATMWLMSAGCIAQNIIHALLLEKSAQTLTLPALRVRFADLVTEIALQTGSDPQCVSYSPDAVLEAAFGKLPPLSTPKADILGFRHDGSLGMLVTAALSVIE